MPVDLFSVGFPWSGDGTGSGPNLSMKPQLKVSQGQNRLGSVLSFLHPLLLQLKTLCAEVVMKPAKRNPFVDGIHVGVAYCKLKCVGDFRSLLLNKSTRHDYISSRTSTLVRAIELDIGAETHGDSWRWVKSQNLATARDVVSLYVYRRRVRIVHKANPKPPCSSFIVILQEYCDLWSAELCHRIFKFFLSLDPLFSFLCPQFVARYDYTSDRKQSKNQFRVRVA